MSMVDILERRLLNLEQFSSNKVQCTKQQATPCICTYVGVCARMRIFGREHAASPHDVIPLPKIDTESSNQITVRILLHSNGIVTAAAKATKEKAQGLKTRPHFSISSSCVQFVCAFVCNQPIFSTPQPYF